MVAREKQAEIVIAQAELSAWAQPLLGLTR